MLCRAVNVPLRLLETLEIHKLEHEVDTLLIHMSTDNVYNGSQPFYKETSPCEPVNCYGITKRDAESLIQVDLARNPIPDSSTDCMAIQAGNLKHCLSFARHWPEEVVVCRGHMLLQLLLASKHYCFIIVHILISAWLWLGVVAICGCPIDFIGSSG